MSAMQRQASHPGANLVVPKVFGSQRSSESVFDQCSFLTNNSRPTTTSETNSMIMKSEEQLLIIPAGTPLIHFDPDEFPSSVMESPGLMRNNDSGQTNFSKSLIEPSVLQKRQKHGQSGKQRQKSEPQILYPPFSANPIPSEVTESLNSRKSSKEKGGKQELTQRWLLEQGIGEDRHGEKSNNEPHLIESAHPIAPLRTEKRSVRVALVDHDLQKRESILDPANPTFKSAHASLSPSFVGVHGDDLCAALASSDIGGIKYGTEDNSTRNGDFEEAQMQLSELEKPQASLGHALSFLVLFKGHEGRFWISERYLNRFTYDHLIRLCVRSTCDANVVDEEISSKLFLHIVLSDQVSEGLGLIHQNDGLNLIQVERWEIGHFPSLQYLLFKNFLLLVAEREGLIRILCSDKDEPLPTALTASRKFWQNYNSEELTGLHGRLQASETIDHALNAEQVALVDNDEQRKTEEAAISLTPIQTHEQRMEKSTQASSFTSNTIEAPVSPSDRFLRSVRGLSSISYTFSSLEHALDDLVIGSAEEQIMSPDQAASTVNRRPLSVPSVFQVKDKVVNQSSRDRCLSSRFSEESDREQLNDEVEEDDKDEDESEQQKSRPLLARIPTISKKSIKIGFNGIYNRSRSNSDACSVRTTTRSLENDSQSLSSATSKSSSFLVKMNAQRQAIGSRATKTLQRFATQKIKNTYNSQWTGYIKRPHTSACESYEQQVSYDTAVPVQGKVESLTASASSLRRRGPPIPLDLSKQFKSNERLYSEVQSPASPLINLSCAQNKDVSPALSTPSVSMPLELLNRLQESHYSSKPLPAVPCDVLDDCQTIDASNHHVHFLAGNKVSSTPLEELCEQRSGTKISLQPDRDDDSDSSHQTGWSTLSTRTFYQDSRVVENIPSIGASPSFTSGNSSTSSLPGINLNRLIPFRARLKDIKHMNNNFEKKLEPQSDVWSSSHSNRILSPQKKAKCRNEIKDSYYRRDRNDSIEDIARNPGVPLLLPLQTRESNCEGKQTVNTSSRSSGHMAHTGKAKGIHLHHRFLEDQYTASDYSNSSPMTYCFASNDMNTPSSVTSSFTSAQSPVHGWRRCSENREPAVRDCVSSLSSSAPTFAEPCTNKEKGTGNVRWQSTPMAKQKSLDTASRISTEANKIVNHEKTDSLSVIYSNSKNSKKKESYSEKSSQQSTPRKKGISASRSFDLLRRNVTNTETRDGDEASVISSKQDKMRRKSTLGLQQFHSGSGGGGEGVNAVEKPNEVCSQSSRAATILRKFRSPTHGNANCSFSVSGSRPSTSQQSVSEASIIQSEVACNLQSQAEVDPTQSLPSQHTQPWFGGSSSSWTLMTSNAAQSSPNKGKPIQNHRKKVTY